MQLPKGKILPTGQNLPHILNHAQFLDSPTLNKTQRLCTMGQLQGFTAGFNDVNSV